MEETQGRCLISTIGELVINLIAKTESFTKDLKKAKDISFDTAKEMERSFKRIGQVAATELAAATVAITALVARSIDYAEQMGKMAEKTGMTTEQFSGYAYSAKLAGVETDQFSKWLVVMDKNLEKSNQKTLEGKAAHSALATLFRGNVPVFQSTNEAFRSIIAQLSTMPQNYQRTALESAIFGRNIDGLNRLVNEGVDGLDKATAEARSFGMVIGTDTAQGARVFNEEIRKVGAITEGLGVQLASKLLPYLNALVTKFVEWATNVAGSESTINSMANAVKVLATVAIGTAEAFNIAGKAVSLFILAGEAAVTTDKATWDALKFQFEDIKESISSTKELLNSLWTGSLQLPKVSLPEPSTEGDLLAPVDPEKIDAVTKAFEAMRAKLQEEIIAFNQGADAAENMRLRMAGFSAEQMAVIKQLEFEKRSLMEFPQLLDPMVRLSGEWNDSWEKANEKVGGWLKESLTPLQQWQVKLDDIIDTFKQFRDVFTDEQFNIIMGHMSDEWDQLNKKANGMKQIQQTLSRGFADLFTTAITDAKDFGNALVSLGKRLMELVIQALVLKPLFDWMSGQGGFLGSIGGLLGGALAGGGDVSAGTSYLVGENGPEIFTPNTSGKIIPNGGMGGTQIIYNIDARGADAGVEERIKRAIAASESRAVQRSVLAMNELHLRTAAT